MIEETITKLEERLKSSGTLPAASRDELLQLLGTLKQEVSELAKTQGGRAEPIIGYSGASSRSATEPVNDQLRNFVASVETSHPKTVQILNRITEIMADLGI
jgi:hypothetical protein